MTAQGTLQPKSKALGGAVSGSFLELPQSGLACSRGENADRGDGVREEGLLSSRSWAASQASLALEGGGDQRGAGPESRDGKPSQGLLGVPLPEPRPPGQLISFQTQTTLSIPTLAQSKAC